MEKSHYIQLPQRLIVRIKNSLNDKPIEIKDILIGIHLFAFVKNDYYLAPFASDEHGVITIRKEWVEASALANLETGIMDYRPFQECSSLVEVYILSKEQVKKLLQARNYWGITAKEASLYQTKEDLVRMIQNCKNSLVQPITKRIVLYSISSSEAEIILYTNSLLPGKILKEG